jgi:tetratricopeptide (TPR) repeat protein
MSVVKLKFSILVVLALSIGASAQDLGSSNKLFGGSKKPTPEKTAKKPPTASKPVSSKTKAAAPKPRSSKPVERKPKTSAAKTSTAKKAATASAKTKFTEFNDAKPSKVEITARKNQPAIVESRGSSEERYEDLIESGNDARDDRNYSAAESAYKSARMLKPKDPRATYGLGNLYSDQQRWEDAENAYRAALQIDPGNAIAHVALSYVLTQPIAAPDLADRYEEAEKVARKAIQLAPANALAFDQLGASLELRGLIGAETENAYRKAIQLDPGFAPAYAHLGRLLRRRGMKQESAAAYENAIKRSNDVATLILVAEVLQSEQRYAESEQLLQRALAGDPRNPGALLLLGRALMAQSKFVEAERALLSNLAVTTNGFAGNSLLGSLYARQGLFDRAEAALMNAARSVSPLEKRGLSMQFESVGDGFMKTGNRRAAERAYRQAITFDAENQALVGKLSRAQRG